MSPLYHPEQLPLFPLTKQCTKCHQDKSLDEFFKQRRGKFGKRAICKDCSARPGSKKRFNPRSEHIGYKRCNTCLQEKPLEAFFVNNQQKDGRNGRCKQCYQDMWNALPEEEKEHFRRRDRERRLPHIEQRRAHNRMRGKLPHRLAANAARGRAKRAEQRAIREAAKRNVPPKTHKICPRCHIDKPLSEFSLDNKRRDGHAAYCKACCSEIAKSNIEKRREYTRKQMLDPEKRKQIRETHRDWRKRNSVREREKNRIRYATNPELRRKMRQASLRWIKAHPLEMHERHLRRLAQIKGIPVEDVSYKRILERDGWICHICCQTIDPTIKKGPARLAFDHVIPLVPRQGDPQGIHSEENIKPAHHCCNGRKSNRRLDDLTPWDRRGP